MTAQTTTNTANMRPPTIRFAFLNWSGLGRVMPKTERKNSVSQASSFISIQLPEPNSDFMHFAAEGEDFVRTGGAFGFLKGGPGGTLFLFERGSAEGEDGGLEMLGFGVGSVDGDEDSGEGLTVVGVE